MGKTSRQKTMTKEQLCALLIRKDHQAEKNIPKSAHWQTQHRPYQGGTGDEKKRDTTKGDEPGACSTYKAASGTGVDPGSGESKSDIDVDGSS